MPARRSPIEVCPDCGGPRTVYGPYHAYCPKCRQESYQPAAQRRVFLRLRYGITEQQYQELYEKQGGCCAICGRALEVLGVDHVHRKKGIEAVRGLLCKECNRGLGLFGDTIKGLEKALNYLKQYESRRGIDTRGV